MSVKVTVFGEMRRPERTMRTLFMEDKPVAVANKIYQWGIQHYDWRPTEIRDGDTLDIDIGKYSLDRWEKSMPPVDELKSLLGVE